MLNKTVSYTKLKFDRINFHQVQYIRMLNTTFVVGVEDAWSQTFKIPTGPAPEMFLDMIADRYFKGPFDIVETSDCYYEVKTRLTSTK